MLSLIPLLLLLLQTAQEPAPKVLMIGIDGVRPDCLVSANTPHLDALAAKGVLKLNARTTSITSSGPAWATILTGARMSMHGVHDNSFEGLRLNECPTWLAQAELAQPDLFTASVAQWAPIHQHLFLKGSVDFSAAADSGAMVSQTAIDLLQDNQKDVDALFLHYDDVDHAGHAHGYAVDIPEYIAAIEQVDAEIGLVLKAIRARKAATKEAWLILVGTDHGGKDKGHGADIPECRSVFMLASGPNAAQWRDSAETHDFAPAALQHLGFKGARIPSPRTDPWWVARQAELNQRAATNTDAKIVFLGDSITHLWEHAGHAIWRKHYADHAAINLGISGDRTEHVLWRLRNGNLDGLAPKVVVLMIGSNNSGQINQEPKQTFLGIQAIVAELRFQLPQTHILLLGIFPRGAKADHPHRILNRRVNELLQPWAAKQSQLDFMNINLHFLTENATLSPEIMPDLLHPNARGYQIWADAIETKLAEAFSTT